MNIPVGKKLISKKIPILIEEYWEKSFHEKYVLFDFSETEWVSNSEMLFLVGWINHLTKRNIEVGVQLPKKSVDSHISKRRSFFQSKLLIDWSLKDNISSKVKIYDGKSRTINSINTINEIVKIPIIEYHPTTFDENYFQLYKNENIGIYKNHSRILNETNLNYLDSDFINYSIIKELYSNVCIHSGLEPNNLCYYSLSVNRKISANKTNTYSLNERKLELSVLESEYFTDKNVYRNLDFVELNFIDFGIGIAKSLKEKYISDIDNLKVYFEEEYDLHLKQNEDSKILHYALLLFTSRYEIQKKFVEHDYIPRGLFIIKELAEKYQGYLEIFSGTGAVSLSFKDGIEKISFAKQNNKKNTFFGTRIRLVFPSKNNIKKSSYLEPNTSKKLRIYQNNVPKFINLLSEYINVENLLKKEINNVEYDVLRTSFFFERITKIIVGFEKGSIVIVDFSGIDIETKDIFSKFIYYISHTPSNASYRLVLINLLVKNLNVAYVSNQSEYKSKGFFAYPVPVIYPDLEIEWLGVDDKELHKILTDIWQGDTRNDTNQELGLQRFSSSVIQITEVDSFEKIEVNLPNYFEVLDYLDIYISDFFRQEINESKIDYSTLENKKSNYNKVLKKSTNTVYHNSYGNYQDSFLTFNDKLYIKTYRRLIATYLIFRTKYLSLSSSKDSRFKFELKEATKILSVTLSSQFLAFEIQKIFEEFFGTKPKIIALSNYYNFHNERKFNDLEEKDKVLVINDIISTGRLTDAIFQSLERIDAIPIFCFAIADLRNEVSSNFNYPIISLSEHKINVFKEKPSGKTIEWINPILNSPVSIKKGKHQLNTLMKQDEFLNFLEDEDILIGNFKNNSYYLTYYIDTYKLLKKDFDNNFELLKLILSKLQEKKKESNISELSIISKGLSIISENTQNITDKKKLVKIKNDIDKINSPTLFNEYTADIIFYPFQSNIGMIEENKNIFKSSISISKDVRIFPIPRILTEKGWRFTFPPKFLNILTANNALRVLIFDDGSCTGSTLMQMIDSIAFLPVKSIDVLSIFGRLEDYQKELFSRLKSIRVKNNVVPLNTFFGVHFNLPVQNDRENPFTQELYEISSLQIALENIYSNENFNSFLNKMKLSLKDIKYPNESSENFIPFDFISKKKMIKFRDKIGLFDSYRFYSEDIPDSGDFKYLIENKESTLTLLAVLNIEPSLYNTLKRLMSPDSTNIIRNHIYELICDDDYNSSLEQQKFFIKSLQYINGSKFIRHEELLRLVDIFEKYNFNYSSYQYLNYLLLLIGLQIRNIQNVTALKQFQSNIFEFIKEIKKQDNELFKKFKYLSEIFRIHFSSGKKHPILVNDFAKLKTYYWKSTNFEGSHDEKLLGNLFEELSLSAKNLHDYYDFPSRDEYLLKYNKEILKIRENYKSNEEFALIKKIVNSFKGYDSRNFNVDFSKLFSVIIELEKDINRKKITKKIHVASIIKSISSYQENILINNSIFYNFLTNQTSEIENIWDKTEGKFNKKGYQVIKKPKSLSHKVFINPLILQEAFEQIIKNKLKFAPTVDWEIFTKKTDNFSINLHFKQYSEFDLHGGGTGFSSVRKLLELFGVKYERTTTEPYYEFRLIFPLNEIDE